MVMYLYIHLWMYLYGNVVQWFDTRHLDGRMPPETIQEPLD